MVSIIVPFFKDVDKLNRCLDSISKQTYKNIETILVDDGSNIALDFLYEQFNSINLKIVYKENTGAGLSRDFGLNYVSEKSEYLIFVDSDDTIENEFLEKTIIYMQNNNLDFCQMSFTIVGKKTKKNLFPSENKILEKDQMKEYMLNIIGPLNQSCSVNCAVWACCFKTKIIKDNKIYFLSEREVLSEDTLFKIDYLIHCNRIGFLNDTSYKYYINYNSLSNSNDYHNVILLKRFFDELKYRLHYLNNNDYQRIYNKMLMFIKKKIKIISKSKIPYNDKRKFINDFINNEFIRDIIYNIKVFSFNKIFIWCLKKKLINLIHLVYLIYG